MKLLGSVLSVATLLVVILGAPVYDVVHGNWPGRYVSEGVTFERFRSGKLAKQLEDQLVENSSLDELVRPRYNEAAFLFLRKSHPGVVVGKDNWLFPSGRIGEPGKAKRRQFAESVEAMGKLVRYLEDRGCTVIIELVPRRRSMYPEQLPDDLDDPFVPLFDYVRDAMLAEGLDVPDLRPVLAPEGELLYYKNDNHWKPEGCHRAAQVIVDRLRERFPDGEVPGKPIDTVFRVEEPREAIGYFQRLLGFAEGSWLFDRFTEETRWMGAYDPDEPRKMYRGSSRPEEVVLIGSSFSAGPYFGASQFISLLGVQVETRAKAGYGAGFRVAEFFAEILTQRRRMPSVLIWEMPEDFPIREGQYFLEPLEATVELLDDAPYRAEPLPVANRKMQGIRVTSEEDGVLKGRAAGNSAWILYQFSEHIQPDEGAVLRFDFNVPKRGRATGHVQIEWGSGIPDNPIASRIAKVRISSATHPITQPLTSPDGETIRFVRIRPSMGAAGIEMSEPEIWRPLKR